nr:NnrS family protein [Sphingomonas sp.]
MAAAHPFLRGGFRPFFFGGAAWAVIAVALWLCTLAGKLLLPTAFDPVAWHRHEMLFGFVGAVIAGFLLTAIPNWTGRLPIAGKPLLALFALWLAGRMSVLFSGIIGAFPAAALDAGFFLVLAALAAREVLEARNRNLPIVGILLLFGLADAIDHAAAASLIQGDFGWQAAIALIALMISLIGGRITPSFTRNWMVKRGITERLPTQPGRFDMFVIGATALALFGWLSAPAGLFTGALLIGAAVLQAARLARWGGARTFSDPLVLVLHLGYAWIPIGLLLLGLSLAGLGIPRSAAIHALTAGAMATMIVAVMTRASLGHTGRELRASAPTVAVYALVTFGAVLRVSAALGLGAYHPMMDAAGTAWAAALAIFLFAYGPILWRPRLGEAAA